ncbi:type II toxin-antitoxin system HicA family toxin [Candidatus Woesearchaeota archaeon]|nr:type II toxin-antitoxin system HicA family toxin [Candidatus Woesearchaeota archaeon]
MKLPRLTGKEVLKELLKQGFIVRNQRGSHVQLLGLVRGEKRLVSVPLHGNDELAPGTLLSIIRQSGFTKEEFVNLF